MQTELKEMVKNVGTKEVILALRDALLELKQDSDRQGSNPDLSDYWTHKYNSEKLTNLIQDLD